MNNSFAKSTPLRSARLQLALILMLASLWEPAYSTSTTAQPPFDPFNGALDQIFDTPFRGSGGRARVENREQGHRVSPWSNSLAEHPNWRPEGESNAPLDPYESALDAVFSPVWTGVTRPPVEDPDYTERNTRLDEVELQDVEADNCAICCDQLRDPAMFPVVQTKCNHQFHKNCILRWFAQIRGRETCPYCRAPLPI